MKRAHTTSVSNPSDSNPSVLKSPKNDIVYHYLRTNMFSGLFELSDGTVLKDKTIVKVLWPNGRKSIYKINMIDQKPYILITANGAQLKFNLIDMSGQCRFRIIDNDFNKSVREYLENPSYETFIKICDNCKPDMNRGLINKDNYGRDLLVEYDIVGLALVYCGYKPICLLQRSLPSVFYKLGLKVLEVEQFGKFGKSGSWGNSNGFGNSSNTKNVKYLVWKLDSQDKNAKELATFLEKDGMSLEWKNASQVIGRYLGYPEEDIEYFINRK